MDVYQLLALEKAQQAFLKYIESTICDGEIEETRYAVKRTKDDGMI